MLSYALHKHRQKQKDGQQEQQPRQNVMVRKVNEREQLAKTRHLNTRNTLICIFVVGFMILGTGVGLTYVGFQVEDSFPNPYGVTGITSMIIGVCILLLSVEIIYNDRMEADDEESSGKKNNKLQWSKPSNKITPIHFNTRRKKHDKNDGSESVDSDRDGSTSADGRRRRRHSSESQEYPLEDLNQRSASRSSDDEKRSDEIRLMPNKLEPWEEEPEEAEQSQH
ncbi:Uncharacterised protein r2_g56 [Pycnogonum litorale]